MNTTWTIKIERMEIHLPVGIYADALDPQPLWAFEFSQIVRNLVTQSALSPTLSMHLPTAHPCF